MATHFEYVNRYQPTALVVRPAKVATSVGRRIPFVFSIGAAACLWAGIVFAVVHI